MKENRSLFRSLVAIGVALAFVTTAAAQTAGQSVAKVVRIKGEARFSVTKDNWQPLKVGDILKPLASAYGGLHSPVTKRPSTPFVVAIVFSLCLC